MNGWPAGVLIDQSPHDPTGAERPDDRKQPAAPGEHPQAAPPAPIVQQAIGAGIEEILGDDVDGEPPCGQSGSHQLPVPQVSRESDDTLPARQRRFQMREAVQIDEPGRPLGATGGGAEQITDVAPGLPEAHPHEVGASCRREITAIGELEMGENSSDGRAVDAPHRVAEPREDGKGDPPRKNAGEPAESANRAVKENALLPAESTSHPLPSLP